MRSGAHSAPLAAPLRLAGTRCFIDASIPRFGRRLDAAALITARALACSGRRGWFGIAHTQFALDDHRSTIAAPNHRALDQGLGSFCRTVLGLIGHQRRQTDAITFIIGGEDQGVTRANTRSG